MASDEALIEQSQNDSVESADVLSQSIDESDMNTSTTTAPLEDENSKPESMSFRGSPENLEIIRSLQEDTGTGIGEQLEKKLSHEITIIDDIPTNESQDDVKAVEADHNVAVPEEDAAYETEAAREVGTGVVVPQIIEDHSQATLASQIAVTAATAESLLDESSNSPAETNARDPEQEPGLTMTEGQDDENNEFEPEGSQSINDDNEVGVSLESSEDVIDDKLAPKSASEVQDNLQSQMLSDIGTVEIEAQQPPFDGTSSIERDSVQVTDLFANDDAQAHEPMPWETEQRDVTHSRNGAATRQVDELFESSSKEEMMPWETNDEKETENSDLRASDAPMTAAFGISAEECDKQSKDTALGPMNEKPSAHDSIPAEQKPMIDGEVAECNPEHSNDLLTSLVDQENKETGSESNALPSPSEDVIQPAGVTPPPEADERTSSPLNLNPDSVPCQADSGQVKNEDKLAAIFGDDETEADSFWVNHELQPDNEPKTAQPTQPDVFSSAPKQGTSPTKFSFLQEDDDLLDVELSEDDDFLPSDDELLSNHCPPKEELGVHVTASTEGPTGEHPSQVSDVPSFTQPASSVHSSGHNSRYEPVQLPKGRESSFSPTVQGNTLQYGIATPRFALQQSLSAQPLSVPSNQEAVEKINEEKKKSDAYDFPIDLFPKKNNIAHAKPVRVPTFAPGAAQQHLGKTISTVSSQNDAYRHASDKSSRDGSLPKNPYASLVAPQSKAQTIPHMPVQGTVPPNVGLKPFPQAGLNQSIPHSKTSQYPAMSILPGDRSRGFSNASIGGMSAKSLDGHKSSPSAPQFPPKTRKTSATKYAPTTQAPYSSVVGKVSNGLPSNGPPCGALPSTNVQASAPPMIPFGGLTSAKTYSGPNAKVMPSALHVPTTSAPNNTLSPTSATTTRRSHARSNSSVYTPNQNEYTAKYAPTVHPQYQNTGLLPQPPGPELEAPYAAVRRTLPEPLGNEAVFEAIDEPVDNQALLQRQFPLINWSASDKIVYAIPSEAAPNAYMMGPGSSLQCLEVKSIDSKIPSSNLLKSFPGPLIKNKVKKRDVEKWLDSILIDYQDSSLEYTILAILRQKLAETIDWKEIARCLYNSDELLSYLSQPLIDSKPKPFSPKLDTGAQLRVLAYLQTGGRDRALAMAIDKGDYAMAMLIGSLMGKDKWAEVVQIYLNNEFQVDSDVSNFSSNLLSLVFQVFVGNSKKAIQEFYSISAKGQWALENWRIIVAAVLNNINLESTTTSGGNVPPIINEFLVEYGLFLAQKGFNAEACIIFSIAGLPFSPSPIGKTSVQFEQIGCPVSLESSIFSEIYEFVTCPDLKGYSSLLSLKLYHAFCLQEHGLGSAASRYADHITGVLKHFSKKAPSVLHIANGLTELSSRVAGSSTGWLGKPKLSSVWGQLDKSFNKYIGGDDDSIVKKPTGKKVFDGFTPVASRNSSMLDVSQFQFTPAHKQAQMGYGTNQGISLPPRTANPMDASFQNMKNNNSIPRAVTEQDPPPSMSPYSVNSSPQQPNSQMMHSGFNPADVQLRRVQTEQAKGANSMGGHPLTAARQQIAQMEAFLTKDDTVDPLGNLAPSNPLRRTSPHYRSTPDLLHKRSPTLNNDLTLGVSKVPLEGSRYDGLQTLQASPVFNSNGQKEFDTKYTYQPPTQNQNPAVSSGGLTYKRENYSQTSVTGPDEVSIIKNDPQDTNLTLNSAEVVPESGLMDRNQDLSMEESDSINEMASTSVLHNDIFGGSRGGVPAKSPEALPETAPNAHEPITYDSQNNVPLGEAKAVATIGSPLLTLGSSTVSQVDRATKVAPEEKEDEACRRGKNYEDDREPHSQAPCSPTFGNTPAASNVVNPYAPLSAENSHEAHETSSPITGPAKTNAYSFGGLPADTTPKLVLEEPVNNILPAVSSPITGSVSTNTSPVDRFNPIKPPEVLTADIFEPVIKKASASRAFTPLVVQSPEDQYDDIVEDESDDEDEEEQRRLLEKQRQEERKKEEEEKKRKIQEKAQAAKEKQKGGDRANGWFSWLKKDPNEKKPIKAKLGHKSTFYYDEKLKRWVNKDASEEEKEKIASPPPPPPVIKRMDNGPKTKPLPSPEAQAKDTVGAILPKNPITGAPLGTPVPAFVGNGDSPAVAPPALTSHPGINLSGKKANGLDDLLSLTGTNGATSRRKRKPARGYVNVMDTK